MPFELPSGAEGAGSFWSPGLALPMRIPRACSGAFLCVLLALLFAPERAVKAEGEPPDGNYSGGTSTTTTTTTSSSSATEGATASVAGSEASDKVGLGIFSRFPLHASVTVEGGYDDNVNTTPSGQQGSAFVTANLVLRMDLGTPRTTVTLSTATGFNYYAVNVDNRYEPQLNLNLNVEHKASPRLGLTFTSYITYQTEPNFEAGLGTNRRNGNYFLTQDQLGVSYIWLPRFSTQTSYGLSVVKYDNSDVGVFEDRFDQTFANQFRFLVYPTTSLVLEYRFEVVSYDHEGEIISPAFIDSMGMRVPALRLERDSTTQFILVGVDHTFNARLNGSFRTGAEFRDYDSGGGSSDSPPYFESTLSYKLGRETGLNWTTRYSIEEGNVAQNPTRKSFYTGLQATHNLWSRVGGTLAVYYYHDDYSEFQNVQTTSPAFTEDSFDFNLSFRYSLNRFVGLQAGYSHTEVSSGDSVRDYSRNRVWAGLNAVF